MNVTDFELSILVLTSINFLIEIWHLLLYISTFFRGANSPECYITMESDLRNVINILEVKGPGRGVQTKLEWGCQYFRNIQFIKSFIFLQI